MCIWKRKNNEDGLNVLKQYVTSHAEPVINALLRSNQTNADVEKLDKLFADNPLPAILYRHSNCPLYLKASIGEILTDLAYLSTSSSFDAFYGKTDGEDLICEQYSKKY